MRNPLTDPRDGDVLSQGGRHYRLSGVDARGMFWELLDLGEPAKWMSRQSFDNWIKHDRRQLIARTAKQWAEECMP